MNIKKNLKDKEKDYRLGVYVHAQTQTPVNIQEVSNAVKKLGQQDDDVIKIILAVYVSTFLEKRDPLWLMIVGNPSSNKTTLVDLLKNVEDIYRIDNLTSNPFSSGQRPKEKPQDLLPLLNGKCFIIKEYATIFGRNDETVKQIISDLVAIYDGEYSKHSPTRGTVRHDSFFSHIGCITPMALNERQRYMNIVGARFMFLKILALSSKEKEKNINLIWNQNLNEEKEKAAIIIRSYCEQIKKIAIEGVKIIFSSLMRKKINLYAQLMSQARGVIITESVDDSNGHRKYEIVDIQIEEPFRALKQLKKLAECLAIVNGKVEITKQELEVIRRVVMSSMPIRRAEVLKIFLGNKTYTASQAAELLNKSYKTVKRNLDELKALKILNCSKKENDKAGIYKLNPSFKDI